VDVNPAAGKPSQESPAERWAHVKSVFLAVIEQPENQRATYLTEACRGDEVLQAEVQSLLDCHHQVADSSFLESLSDESSPRAVLEAMANAMDATRDQSLTHVRESERPTNPDPGITDVPADDQFGDYRLLETIGQGAMGVVYRARQRSLNRTVALKMIRAGRFSTPGEIERFAREAEAAASLTHPGIVQVYEIGEQEGHHYYTMALIEGESLANHLKNANGPLEPNLAAELIHQVAAAVQYAHEHGVVHRDLKPANILLDKEGQPRVVDFGLAKQMETESGLTVTGQILGTPSFMSPEQAAGETVKTGASADIYSLGAVLYVMLTGRPPFSAAGIAETLRQVQHDEPVRPRQLNSALPKDLETICLKCLSKEPARRYESARDMADELHRFLSDRPILARPVGSLTTAVRWCRRNPLAASFATFVAIFVPVVILALALMNLRLAQESQRALFESQMADRSFRAAKAAVDEQFTLVSEETLLDRPGLQPLRRQLLLGSQKYYQEFLSARGDDPDLRAEVALINFRLGVMTAMLGGGDDQNAYTEANRYFDIARHIYERLPNQESPRVLAGLGNVWTRVGQIHNKLHEYPQERDAFRTALKIRSQLVEVEANVENQRQLANAEMNFGQSLVRRDADTQGNPLNADREHLQRAQSIRERLLTQEPNNANVIRDTAKGHILIADSLADDQTVEIERNLTSAIHLLNALANLDDPTLEDTFLRAVIAKRLGGLVADTASNADALSRARDYFEQALKILNPLTADNPQVTDYLSATAATYYESALVCQDLGETLEAQQRLHVALKLLGPLIKGNNPDDILHCAGAHMILAELESPESQSASEHLRAARALLLEKLAAVSGETEAETVRDEYQAAIDEIELILAERNRT